MNGTVIRTRHARAMVRIDTDKVAGRPMYRRSLLSARAGQRVEAVNNPDAHVGDRVEVMMPETAAAGRKLRPFMPAAAIPLAGALAGAVVGGHEAAGIGIAVGLAVGFVAAAIVSYRVGMEERSRTRVLRVVDYAAGLNVYRSRAR